MHQLRMRPFKLFWGWIKNPSSSSRIFEPPSLPQKFPFLPTFAPSYLPLPLPTYPPSYLPHHISHSLHLKSLVELLSLSDTELCDTWLEEGGEFNVVGTWRVQGTWRWKGKKSASSQMRKWEKKGKLPPFFAFVFSLCFFFLLEKKKTPSSSSLMFLFPTYLPPLLPPSYLPPLLHIFCATIAATKKVTTISCCHLLCVWEGEEGDGTCCCLFCVL